MGLSEFLCPIFKKRLDLLPMLVSHRNIDATTFPEKLDDRADSARELSKRANRR
jgi:hypothetical protein